MSHYVPAMNSDGNWVTLDAEDNITCPVPAYSTRVAAQSWCDLKNATLNGEEQEEIDRLWLRHDEVRALPQFRWGGRRE